MRATILTLAILFVLPQAVSSAADAPAPNFAHDVAPLFNKYCAGCHNGTDREGDLSLDSFADLQKGGKKGPVVVSGQADASLLIRALTGEIQPSMPPEDNPRPTDNEIAVLRAWIDAGAAGPEGAASPLPELKTPKLAPAAGVHPYLTSMAISPDGKLLALGSYRHVELVDPETKKVLATTAELPGKVMNVNFSRDGLRFVASSGIAGLYGMATICRTSDGGTISQIQAHHDAIYDAEFSPDGRLLATCSYDRLVSLWSVEDGKLIRNFAGHNGAVYDVAFSPDGSLLATASADDTVKIWSVKTGERLDTLGQAEGEQCSVAFSPDSKFILAAGADRQLRMWTLISRDKPDINPLKSSRTAHNSSILKLAISPDGSRLVTASAGRELVLWDMISFLPIHRYELQPDIVTGLAFDPSGQEFYVGSINGHWQKYDVSQESKGNVVAANDVNPSPSDTTADDAEAAPAPSDEQEPNNSPATANSVGPNALIKGTISVAEKGSGPDVDLFRFHAQKGEQLVLEINAARNKSLLDSKLEVLDADGKPIPRVVLQAVRSSYYTFRGHDSTDVNDFRMHGAIEMEPNEYVYANGEVMKLWMLPRGPDSGFLVYPGVGAKRFTYFGTTAITHALNEPCYVVQAHSPNETLIPNGLPTYTVYFENDDDGWRRLGADSRLAFTAPQDGDYFAKVSDIRAMGGEKFTYELTIRPARPGFEVHVTEKNLTINAGSGKEFTVTANRKDEFDGEISIVVAGLPPGFHATTPLTIEAGQTFAYGTITADADAPPLTAENAKLTNAIASAEVNGKLVVQKPLKFGELKLADRPKILARILPITGGPPLSSPSGQAGEPTELSIAPGETITATLKVERNGFDEDIKFGGEHAGRNLPHGVYVDNIGLNGVTLLKGENERTIFITARKWVPEQTRLFHLQAEEDGKQTTASVLIRVRKRGDVAAPASQSVATTPAAN